MLHTRKLRFRVEHNKGADRPLTVKAIYADDVEGALRQMMKEDWRIKSSGLDWAQATNPEDPTETYFAELSERRI